MAITDLKAKQSITNDLVASLVVFLVALPLCMGIAIASGVPPALGLVTGMVGGIIVAPIGGSPFRQADRRLSLPSLIASEQQRHITPAQWVELGFR